MATVGQQLTAPESGWRRYDDTDSRLLYVGKNWTHRYKTNSANYKDTLSFSYINSILEFVFYGTKFRIIDEPHIDRSDNISVYIDDTLVDNINQTGSYMTMRLIYEKIGLSRGSHRVRIINNTNKGFTLDAIDIDSDGYLLHPVLTQRTKLEDMEVGDCIPCRYIAPTSGLPGYFSELGTCIADEIPVTGTATPNGLFYFYKLDTGKLGADRVVQTNVSWDALNAAKYTEGRYKPTNIKQAPIFHFPLNSTSTFQSIYGTSYLTSVTGTLTLAASPYGQAVYFNGASRINSNAKMLPIGAKSLRFKIKYAANSNHMFVMSNVYDTAKQYGLSVYATNDGYMHFSITNNSNHTSNVFDLWTGGPLSYDNWHDVLFTWDGTTNTNAVKVYVDGLLSNQTTAISLETTQPSYNLAIGGLYGSQGQAPWVGYTGYLSNLEIYNYVITPDELEYSIRSFSGGNSYLGADGLPKLTDQGLGAWPQNNEWDTYVVKSDLGGKVTPGDDAIWHYNNRSSLAKDTVVTGFTRGDTAVADSTHRMLRSINIGPIPSLLRPWFVGSSIVDIIVGFRPLVEYKHEKQITSWY